MSGSVYLAFATSSPEGTAAFLDRVAEANSDAAVVVVARRARQKSDGREWIEIPHGMGTGAIVAACRKAAAGRNVRGAAIHATRGSREWRMRVAALIIAGRGLRIYNDNLDDFPIDDAPVLWRHLKWRWRQRPRGRLWWKLLAALAQWCAGRRRAQGEDERRLRLHFAHAEPDPGISVIIPSRNGRELLSGMLPRAVSDLKRHDGEIIVMDNGSTDGTAAFLREQYPAIRIEASEAPVSFAAAVNRGIGAARFSHIVLLNNDMEIAPGFFGPLRAAFDRVPDLFCATAQIFFPEGQRREETGLCFWHRNPGDDFPVYCAVPQEGEDGTLVLYGSGGCSMYDALKLRALGGFDEAYEPAYVEDLDIGYRAWLKGWPTVFCAEARVEHRHRATTSQYFKSEFLDYLVERNYLRFLVRATGQIFPELWRDAIARLEHRAADGDGAARRVLRTAWREALSRRVPAEARDERALKLSLTR